MSVQAHGPDDQAGAPMSSAAETQNLEVGGPFYWTRDPSVFAAPEAQASGIYLWSVQTDEGDLIYYVGETGRTFGERMKEHLKEYLSGMYEIYHPEAFLRGEKRMLWKGMYSKGEEVRVGEFLARHQDLIPAVQEMIRAMRFWLMPVECERRLRCRIEGAISRHLREQPGPIGGFQDEGIHYQYRDPSEAPVQVRLSFESRLLGLPRELVA